MVTIMVPTLTLIYDRRCRASKDKAGVVELRITLERERKYISTGVKLLPKEWSNGSVVGRKDWKELNDQLQIIKKKASEIITKMMEEGNMDLNAVPGILKSELIQQETFIDYAKELSKRRFRTLSEGTKNHYKVLFNFLEEWKGLVYFSDITERSILKMDDALSAKGLKVQTRWNYHKLMKSFIKQAVEDGLLKYNPYSRLDIKRGNESGLTRFLTPAEFHRFETCLIPLESLRKVRDLFVFQTYTMMGYSDLAKFNYKECFKLKGQMVYKNNRVKTGKEFTFALLQPALNILKKYNYKLPIISNVKYNLYLKSAVMYAGIDKMVSCHWARHTGATMLLNEGKVDINTISKILGDTLRETERTYAKLMDESIVDSMVNYQKSKLG